MRQVCLFAHFDRDNKVDEYVIRYLKKIKELDFLIVFISASQLSPLDIEGLRCDCHDVILRQNVGLDFGSWAAGFAKHGSAITGRLLLANDSVYGPIGNLRTALDRLTRRSADFYGFVESGDLAPHLQSWFLLFEPWVVRDPTFKAVFEQQFSAMNKKEIIVNGEVGLSCRLIRAGFRYESLYKYSSAGIAARSYPISPPHCLWRELLFDYGIPFLKIELLRDNPLLVEDSAAILSALEPLDPAYCGLIKSHLVKRIGKDGQSTVRRTALARWLTSSMSRLVRNGYRLHKEERCAAEAFNFCKLAFFLALVRAKRIAYTLFTFLARSGISAETSTHDAV